MIWVSWSFQHGSLVRRDLGAVQQQVIPSQGAIESEGAVKYCIKCIVAFKKRGTVSPLKVKLDDIVADVREIVLSWYIKEIAYSVLREVLFCQDTRAIGLQPARLDSTVEPVYNSRSLGQKSVLRGGC